MGSTGNPLEALRRWSLGVPEPKRGKRLVVSLIAHIDESVQGQVLVYAGYVARLNGWESLTAQWQACLDIEPKLSYFKMNEAWGRKEEWRPFSIPERNHRVCQFYQILAAHVLGGVSVVLPVDVFKEAFASRPEVPRQMKNKHFFLMYNLMHDLLRFSYQIGLDEPIDFVFDDQARGKDQIFNAWASFSKHSPTPKHRFGGSPRFEKDHETLPLQAADLGAWMVRRNSIRFLANEPEETFPWSGVSVTYKRISRIWDRDGLIKQAERGSRNRTNRVSSGQA